MLPIPPLRILTGVVGLPGAVNEPEPLDRHPGTAAVLRAHAKLVRCLLLTMDELTSAAVFLAV